MGFIQSSPNHFTFFFLVSLIQGHTSSFFFFPISLSCTFFLSWVHYPPSVDFFFLLSWSSRWVLYGVVTTLVLSRTFSHGEQSKCNQDLTIRIEAAVRAGMPLAKPWFWASPLRVGGRPCSCSWCEACYSCTVLPFGFVSTFLDFFRNP